MTTLVVVFGSFVGKNVSSSSVSKHIYIKFKFILTKHINNNHLLCFLFNIWSTVQTDCCSLLFSLLAISQPPRCRPSCHAGDFLLSAPRGETNTWRSPETRVASESGATHVPPLTPLSGLPVKGSTLTSTLTCEPDKNMIYCSPLFLLVLS